MAGIAHTWHTAGDPRHSHPGVVRLLIAHEPGLYPLLEGAERDEALRGHREAIETFQREGIPAAMKLMFARSGTEIDSEAEVPMPSVSMADPKAMEQHFANLRHFLTCDVPAVIRYQPDIAAVTLPEPRSYRPLAAPPLHLPFPIGALSRWLEFCIGHQSTSQAGTLPLCSVLEPSRRGLRNSFGRKSVELFGSYVMPTQQISRRTLLSLPLVLLPKSAFGSHCSLGDDEWFQRFRAFVKVFNAFVNSLNDGKVDLHTWRDHQRAAAAM